MKLYGTFDHAGIPGLIYRGRRIVINPQTGRQYEYLYEGSPQAVLAGANQVASDQIVVIDERDDGNLWGLSVTTADDPTGASANVVANTFELVGNSVQKDIREHPLILELGYEKIGQIDELLTAPQSEVTSTNLDAIGALNSTARNLYNDLRQRNGNMAYQESQYVFRVSKIVSKRNQALQIAYANVNRLYTTDQVIAETNPPSDYILSLNSLAASFVVLAELADYPLTWLKGSPTLTEAPGNRNAVQYEFNLDQWPTRYYANKA